MALVITATLIVLASIALRLAVPLLGKDSVAGGIVHTHGESSLADCPDSPNCQCSESTRDSQKVDRLSIEQPADVAMQALHAVLNQQGAVIVSSTDRYVHATFTTRLMGYTDDVEFLVSDDQLSLQVRSASRIGKSDLGANRRRVVTLRAALAEEMG